MTPATDGASTTMTVGAPSRAYAGSHGVDAVGRVTLQTVADKVGVSRMTVSNAFSRPDQLSTQLRDKVLAAAAELGYVGPDPSARALARGSTGAVGVVLTESTGTAFRDPIAAAFFGAVAEELGGAGMAVSLLPSQGSPGHVPARDVAMDGALVYACAWDTVALDWLVRRRLPMVFVDQEPLHGAGAILLDERMGGRLQAQHVVDLGHRDIAVLTMNFHRPTHGWAEDPRTAGSDFVSRGRLAGVLDVLDPLGLTPRVYEARDNDDHFVVPAARDLVASMPGPTAVLCFSDLMAAAVLAAAHEAGLRVPEDLSVVGFDDSPVAERLRPPLTTVHQDFVAKGKAAATALTAAIARARAGEPDPGERVLIPVDLVVRESTAPPPH